MRPVELHPSAAADIRRIKNHAPKAAAAIAVLIQEMGGDPDLHDRLLEHGVTDGGRNVKHWWTEYKAGNDLWRLRLLEPEGPASDYRIIYGYVPYAPNQQARFCVLAVVHRGEFNYERDSEIGQRIVKNYRELLF